MSDYNLLIITPDQLRRDYVGTYGHPFIGTRHIDALAARGVRVENAYCAAPLCGPSRISFATSTAFSEHNRRNYGSTIDYNAIPNLISVLKGAGRSAGLFGKNHVFHVPQLGDIFDEYHRISFGNYDEHPKYAHSWSSFEMEADNAYNMTGELTTMAIDFMQRQMEAGKPFVTWVNYQDPHPAFMCPEPYYSLFDPDQFEIPASFTRGRDKSKPRRLYNWKIQSEMPLATEQDVKAAMAAYCGQIRYVDDQVGRMWESLEEAGIADRTIILFFADHGEFLGDHGVFHKLPVFYECLTHIPCILYHPDWPAGTFEGLVEEIDFTPTLLEGLGLEIPPTMTGHSIAPNLAAGEGGGRESLLVEAGIGAPTPQQPIEGAKHRAPFPPNSFGPGAMLRVGPFKLSHYADDQNELYDLESDPHEMRNLYDDPEYADVRRELTECLLDRVLSVKVRDVGVQWPGEGPDPRWNPIM
jgi:arylsulfatase A-like enzyme